MRSGGKGYAIPLGKFLKMPRPVGVHVKGKIRTSVARDMSGLIAHNLSGLGLRDAEPKGFNLNPKDG
jgi:hypothetical protein